MITSKQLIFDKMTSSFQKKCQMTSQIVGKPQIRPKLITCSLAFWTRPSQFCPDNQTALWDLGLLSQSRFSSQILVSPSLHILENFNPRVRTNHLSSIIVLSSSFLQYSSELLRNKKKNLSFQLTQKIVFTLTRLFYLLLVLTRQKISFMKLKTMLERATIRWVSR